VAAAIAAKLETRLWAVVVPVVSASTDSSDWFANRAEGHGRTVSLASFEYADIDDLVDAVQSAQGPIATLANVVEIRRSRDASEASTLSAADEILREVSFMSHRVGRHMLDHGGGTILTILCHAGRSNELSARTYNAVLVGVRNLTSSLARDWVGEGVRVNLLTVPHLADELADREAPGRAPTLSTDRVELGTIVDFVALFADESAASLTGQVLALGCVDDGLL
jgi:Dehydrogenases with different specificities (related to short-chain alcohol dehydrogenases)